MTDQERTDIKEAQTKLQAKLHQDISQCTTFAKCMTDILQAIKADMVLCNNPYAHPAIKTPINDDTRYFLDALQSTKESLLDDLLTVDILIRELLNSPQIYSQLGN